MRPHKRERQRVRDVGTGYEGVNLNGRYRGQLKKRSTKIKILGDVTRYNVGGYSYRQNIPKRQFIGDSKKLNTAITNLLYKEIDEIFK